MKNNPSVGRNEVSMRQFAVLMFILTFTFKVSRLPPLVAKTSGSSGAFLICLYLALETVMFFVVFKFVSMNGAEELKDSVVFKVLSPVLAAAFLFKIILMYAGTVIFSLELMFENVSTFEITLTLMIPVAYSAYKGVNSIARASEICIWIIAAVLISNLVFIKANPRFENNLPLVSDGFFNLLSDGDKFFFWFGDFTPLMFVKLSKGKKRAAVISLAVSVAAVVLSFVLMSALYGAAAEYISNFIVRLAGFNQFAAELGRLDWSGMIIWLIMALIFLSVYMWAFTEAGAVVIKKRAVPFTVCIIAVLCSELFTKEVTEIVDFALTDIRWLAVAANYIVPVILLITLTVQKKRAAAVPAIKEIKNEPVA